MNRDGKYVVPDFEMVQLVNAERQVDDMAQVLGIGIQDFEKIRERDVFYVDKTNFIRDWWESADEVTLITRPRRFGKTLLLSMVEQFFSVQYAGRSDLFEGLNIWEHEKYRQLQGTYPVISLSFGGVKDNNYISARRKICFLITHLYSGWRYYLEKTSTLSEKDQQFFDHVSMDMNEEEAVTAIL